MSEPTRRQVLIAGGLAVAGLAVGRAAPATADPSVAGYVSPHGDHEPSRTEIRVIDGVNVVHRYGRPAPSIDVWAHRRQPRQYLDLDGTWRLAFDADNGGLGRGWHRPSFDDSGWRAAPVPLPWDLVDQPGFGGYDGTGYGTGTAFVDGYAWYRRKFRVPGQWADDVVRLHFLGVSYTAWVYVDGDLVGRHDGGHTPFTLHLGRLAPGTEHTLAVRVWRRPTYPDYGLPVPPAISDDREVPYTAVDYWPYAGITRSVFLEASSAVSVSKLLTATRGTRLTVHAVVVNESGAPARRTLVLSPGAGCLPERRDIQIDAGSTRVVTVEFDAGDAPRWSSDSPVTHELVAELHQGADLTDALSTPYGIREVTVADGRVLVDGRAQFFKAMNWHEETAAHGASMTIAEYDAELAGMAAIGVNLIRNSVYTRHPYTYDWADRHGMMILDDCDNMWLNRPQQQLQTESYGQSRAVATMMAWHQVNHPSVLMWSLQNESEVDNVTYRAWLTDMKAAVKAADPQQRPVTWASATSQDPVFDVADVVGFNEYFGYFYGTDEDLGPTLDAVAAAHPGKPILITENGTWALPDNHGGADVQGTEEWQAESFRRHWAQVVTRDQVCGYTFWVYKDYKQRRGYNYEYNGISVMGLLDFTDERPKLVRDAFRQAVVPPR